MGLRLRRPGQPRVSPPPTRKAGPGDCHADFLDATLDCELPAGHEGDHRCTFTWEQMPARQLARGELMIAAGYISYLQHKYGNASGS